MGNVIGNSAKRATRFAKRFNLENRVNKVLEQEKPKPAPRHETTTKLLEEFADDNPEIFDEQKRKDLDLHERLKQVRLESTGSLPEIKSRRLPERNRLNEPKIYGYRGVLNPQKVPEGRISLKDTMKILTKVQEAPDPNAAKNIAKEYKLDMLHVQQLLRYFKALEMKFPDSIKAKYPSLAENLRDMVKEEADNLTQGMKVNQQLAKDLVDDKKIALAQKKKKTDDSTSAVHTGMFGDDRDLIRTEIRKELGLSDESTDKQLPGEANKQLTAEGNKDKGETTSDGEPQTSDIPKNKAD